MSESQQVQESRSTNSPSRPAAPLSPSQQMLIDFLRDHDAACPMCGYNVRALTRPTCPECRQELTLTVGLARLRMGWLFAAVAPGMFSGIAAIFLLVPVFARLVFGDGVLMTLPLAIDLFGWCSGIFAIMLAVGNRGRWRMRFLALSPARQRWIALTIWLIHIAALGMFILIGVVYF
jgi:hypothetical protein